LSSLQIVVPALMSLVLLWWVSRGMTWATRLIVAVVTLAAIVALLAIEGAGYWPDRFRR
jgi:hypothetical protein